MAITQEDSYFTELISLLQIFKKSFHFHQEMFFLRLYFKVYPFFNKQLNSTIHTHC